MWFKSKVKNKRHSRRNVLDVRLRSDQLRAVRARGVVVMIGVLFGTVFTAYVLWRSCEWGLDRLVYENRAFAIQIVDVSTDGEISLEQLRRWTGVQPGQNLMALDLARVKSNLELVPNIRSVSVERLLPGTLRIRVTERHPIASVYLPRLLEGEGLVVQTWLLDAEGAVMLPLEAKNRRPSAGSVTRDLPVLTGVRPGDLRLGRAVDSGQVQAALRLVDTFNHSGMGSLVRLSSVDVGVPGVLVIMTESGARVTFGNEALDRQLRRWREIHQYSLRLNKEILTLDLAVENNLPVRWVEATDVNNSPTT